MPTAEDCINERWREGDALKGIFDVRLSEARSFDEIVNGPRPTRNKKFCPISRPGYDSHEGGDGP